MAYTQQIKQMALTESYYRQQWCALLNEVEISVDKSQALSNTHCIGIFEGERLVATGSYQSNVLKYIAVDPTRHDGQLFNLVISTLMTELAQQGIFHVFVFTKPRYQKSFEYVGFKALAETEAAVLLETGDRDVAQYLAGVPRVANQANLRVSAVVINANPFTLGHRYLIEQAAAQSDLVYVFVVSQDVSLFSTTERLQLVKQGTADLTKVQVVAGGEYLISYATFPAYFLPSNQDVTTYQTRLDAQLFKQQIAPPLNITHRFVGAEPFSQTTASYNQALLAVLPPALEVTVIPRLQQQDRVITATRVRQAIAANQLAAIATTVPKTTLTFIQQNLDTLQTRIKKGMRINGN